MASANNVMEMQSFLSKFELLDLNNSGEMNMSDLFCQKCTPQLFCENCLKNGVSLAPFNCEITKSNDNYSPSLQSCETNSVSSLQSDNSYETPTLSLAEYNLHRLAAIHFSDVNSVESKIVTNRQSHTVFDSNEQKQRELHLLEATSNNNDISRFAPWDTKTYFMPPMEDVFSGKLDRRSPFESINSLSYSVYNELKIIYSIRSVGTYIPYAFCLGSNDEIIVADKYNHRIQIYDKNGIFQFEFGKKGCVVGRLNLPGRVAVIRSDGRFIVCDRGLSRTRLQSFDRNGDFIKQFYFPDNSHLSALNVTNDDHILAVECELSVFVFTKNGDIVRWFSLNNVVVQVSDIVKKDSDFYISDYKAHCIVVFDQNGHFQRKFGNETDIPNPSGLDICSNGNILISIRHGNLFKVIDCTLDGIQSLFCFQDLKVIPNILRSYSLKITSEGLLVTLAKHQQDIRTVLIFKAVSKFIS